MQIENLKILYLYSELMGYQIPLFKEYIIRYNAEVHIIHWNHKKFTPYIPPQIDNVFYYNRSKLKTKDLVKFVNALNPQITYISGWMDKGYLVAARQLIKRGIPVVSGFDNIWKSTIKQQIAAILFPLIRSYFFSHAWVAGPYQYEYVKRLGFKNSRIIYNCLSTDIEIFNNAFQNSLERKRTKYPHSFLYVGRFELIKGIDILVKAWNNIQSVRKDWDLCLIGNGSLKFSSSIESHLIVKDFMYYDLLSSEISKSGCAVIPSRSEAWSLVMHEFSAGGLPIICSDVCGAVPIFLIQGFNGYIFSANDVRDLEEMLLKIINTSDEKLMKMSENSHVCGQKITPEMAAASFMSVLPQ